MRHVHAICIPALWLQPLSCLPRHCQAYSVYARNQPADIRINISEELFQRKMKDIEETNKYVEKHLKAGTKYRVGKLDEKYLNSLLNYEAK